MASAFVMISCDYGQEKRIIEEIRSMIPVKQVEETLGAYDIVVKLESKSVDIVKEAVTGRIARMNSVRSVLTLLVN